jgi:protoheme IX farnesyltransferase
MAVGSRPLVPSRLGVLGHGDGPRSPRSKLAGYVALTKPRIIELLLITTVPTMILAEEGLPDLALVAWTLLGGSLAAGGANAINMYADRDIDRLMPRTQGRPLVTGLIAPRHALVFAVALEVAAVLVLSALVNVLSALLALSATLFYVFVYTLWLKRTSTRNIVIGGAAGAVPVLVGWAAVTDGLAWPPVLLFGVIFLWTPPHFWALAIRYADDYRAAAIPMLPAVAPLSVTSRRMLGYTLALWIASLALIPVAGMGLIYGLTALVLGAVFVTGVLSLQRTPTARVSMRVFSFSITYVTVLFVAIAADTFVQHGW